MTKLFLVRHAETEANLQKIWYGLLDAPLTERGEQQILATGQRMKDLARYHPIDAFYVSPLGRTQKTAAAIAEQIAIVPTVEDGLREFDLGDWEGRSYVELAEHENLWGRWKVEPDFRPPNGESALSFHNRAIQIIETLVAKHAGETVLAVTHGGIICNVMALWMGEGLQDWPRWEPDNGSITLLTKQDGEWQIEFWDDVSHFPPDAVVDEKPVYTRS